MSIAKPPLSGFLHPLHRQQKELHQQQLRTSAGFILSLGADLLTLQTYLTNYLLPTEHTYSEMEMKSIEGTNQESTKSGIERGR